MKQPLKKTINSRDYLIGCWEVDKSLEILVWLTKTFGEGVVTLFTSEAGMGAMLGKFTEEVEEAKTKEVGEAPADPVATSEADKAAEAKLIKEFASSIVDKLDQKQYPVMCKHIIAGIRYQAQPINFNNHFVGRLGELHELMFHTIRFQYADFLGESDEGGL